jgi:hypothetical protein
MATTIPQTNFGELTVPMVNTPIQIASADGAISIKNGLVLITKGSACALTLAAPVAGDDDGKILHVLSTTAFAHTITYTAGLNGAGAGADVGTFAAAVGNRCAFVAYNGVWWMHSVNVGVTFA